LWGGESVQVVQQRSAELMKSGKGQLHLRFDPERVDHAASIASFGDVVEERRFSDPGLATKHERGAPTGLEFVDEVVEP
jgi:hypothetical protein